MEPVLAFEVPPSSESNMRSKLISLGAAIGYGRIIKLVRLEWACVLHREEGFGPAESVQMTGVFSEDRSFYRDQLFDLIKIKDQGADFQKGQLPIFFGMDWEFIESIQGIAPEYGYCRVVRLMRLQWADSLVETEQVSKFEAVQMTGVYPEDRPFYVKSLATPEPSQGDTPPFGAKTFHERIEAIKEATRINQNLSSEPAPHPTVVAKDAGVSYPYLGVDPSLVQEDDSL